MTRLRRPGEDQGSAAVEFALVLPVLMIIIFGIIDFGRLLNAKITLSQAAHEGARAAAIVSDDEARTVIAELLGSMDSSVQERVIEGCADGADEARVRLTYRFTYVTPLAFLTDLGDDDGMAVTTEAVVPCL